MLSTWKERIVFIAIVVVHLLIFLLSMLTLNDPPPLQPTVLQAELISPPTPKKPAVKPQSQTPTPPTPPKLLSIAPSERQATTKPEEKTQEKPKEKSEPVTPTKTEQAVNTESAKLPEPVASSNSAKSTSPIGTDSGTVELNQLIMVYRPNTEVFYPRLSKDIGEQGIVGVKMMIDETGAVKTAQIMNSSGFERLDRAACELASRIRFAPYKVNGVPSRVSAGISIKFQLNR